MFTAYGLNGRIFSGPLEGLRALGPVQALARLRAVEPLAHDGQVVPSVVLEGLNPEAGAALLGSTEPLPRDALAAYAKTQAQTEAQTQVGPSPRQPINRVEQLMTRELLTVPLAATLAQAWALLAKARVGQAPVLNAEGRLVGLLLRADLLPLPEQLDGPATWAAWFERPVAQLMWSPVPSALPHTPIREVAQALLDLNLPGLPVMSPQGELLGFLSRSDILRALTREPPLDLWG